MFSITISFGNPATMWTLMWRTKEAAEEMNAFLENQIVDPTNIAIEVRDDFGQYAFLRNKEINGFMFEDLDLSKLVHVERALHQSRMQVKAAEMAQTDPVLRAARVQQGPAILTPMGPGMNGGGFGSR